MLRPSQSYKGHRHCTEVLMPSGPASRPQYKSNGPGARRQHEIPRFYQAYLALKWAQKVSEDTLVRRSSEREKKRKERKKVVIIKWSYLTQISTDLAEIETT